MEKNMSTWKETVVCHEGNKPLVYEGQNYRPSESSEAFWLFVERESVPFCAECYEQAKRDYA